MATVSSHSSSLDTTTPRLSVPDWIALVLMIVGAVNWGLVGTINVDLVAAIFGDRTMAARIVYGLVGLAGLWGLTMPMRLRSRA